MIETMKETDTPTALPLAGKTVVITGATSGIGLTAAIAFAAQGAVIIGLGRSPERADQAIAAIKDHCPDAVVRYVLADLTSQAQIRSAAKEIQSILAELDHPVLDILINNAGTYAPKLILTEDGYETIFAVNHLAPFLLTHELLPALQQSPDGKVLTTSSGSHYRTWLNLRRVVKPLIFNGLWAYKVSKLCNVLFTREFNRRYSHTTVRAFAVDPGLVSTDIGFKHTDWLSKLVWSVRKQQGTPPEVPVRTMLHLALTNAESLYNEGEIYWKDSQPKTPSHQSQRPEQARKLWDASLHWCGIKEEGQQA